MRQSDVLRVVCLLGVCVGTLLCPAAPCPAQAAFADALNRSASGNSDEAFELFSSIAANETMTPNVRARAAFNAGCSLLDLKRLDEAAEQFRLADLGSPDDATIRARARFNLGQALYLQAQGNFTNDPLAARDTLARSASAFRAAWAADPSVPEAARNLELIRRMIKSIDDMQKELERQRQQQQQQNQQAADDLKQLADQQRQAADSSQQASQSEDASEQSEQLSNEQNEVDKKTQGARSQLDQNPSAEAQSAQTLMDRAMREQQQAQQALQDGQISEAEQHQRRAAELLDQAAERLAGTPQPHQDQPRDQSDNQDDQQAAEQGQQQTDPGEDIARKILANDEETRKWLEQRRSRERSRVRPVEKDW